MEEKEVAGDTQEEKEEVVGGDKVPGGGGQVLEIGCVVHHPDWKGVLCNLDSAGSLESGNQIHNIR